MVALEEMKIKFMALQSEMKTASPDDMPRIYAGIMTIDRCVVYIGFLTWNFILYFMTELEALAARSREIQSEVLIAREAADRAETEHEARSGIIETKGDDINNRVSNEERAESDGGDGAASTETELLAEEAALKQIFTQIKAKLSEANTPEVSLI